MCRIISIYIVDERGVCVIMIFKKKEGIFSFMMYVIIGEKKLFNYNLLLDLKN